MTDDAGRNPIYRKVIPEKSIQDESRSNYSILNGIDVIPARVFDSRGISGKIPSKYFPFNVLRLHNVNISNMLVKMY